MSIHPYILVGPYSYVPLLQHPGWLAPCLLQEAVAAASAAARAVREALEEDVIVALKGRWGTVVPWCYPVGGPGNGKSMHENLHP